MRWIASLLWFLVVLSSAMGATINFTSITPNPAGLQQRIEGDGKYTLGANEKLIRGSFAVTLKGTMQTTFGAAVFDQMAGTWTCTLQVAAATYNPSTATMWYVDANGNNMATSASDLTDYIVN
jgi:hypothetical protein